MNLNGQMNKTDTRRRAINVNWSRLEKITANDFQTNKNLFLENIMMGNLLLNFIESRKKTERKQIFNKTKTYIFSGYDRT